MGIRGSLLLSSLLHAGLLFASLLLLPHPREEYLLSLDLVSIKTETVQEESKGDKRALPREEKLKEDQTSIRRETEEEPKRMAEDNFAFLREEDGKKHQGEKRIQEKQEVVKTEERKNPALLEKKEEPSLQQAPSREYREVYEEHKRMAEDNLAFLREENGEKHQGEKRIQEKHESVKTEERKNPTLLEKKEEPSLQQAPSREYREVYLEENLTAIREILRIYLRYPPVARRMGWEGAVLVRFTLTPDGALEESKVEKSSGYEVLDRNALETVKLAHRDFPKPKKKVTLLIPIVYKLE